MIMFIIIISTSSHENPRPKWTLWKKMVFPFLPYFLLPPFLKENDQKMDWISYSDLSLFTFSLHFIFFSYPNCLFFSGKIYFGSFFFLYLIKQGDLCSQSLLTRTLLEIQYSWFWMPNIWCDPSCWSHWI